MRVFPIMHAAQFKDMSGQRFGKLVVTTYAFTKNAQSHWNCVCDCGEILVVKGTYLRTNDTLSCGCLRGFYKTILGVPAKSLSEWRVWRGMISRCHCPTDKSFQNWGGRGIVVCDDWRFNFLNFYKDMGPRPSKTTMHRIDNDGPYNKENCKWATHFEQNRNKRGLKLIEFNGITLCHTEWEERLKLPRCTIYNRLKYGWSIEKALTTPPANR